MMATGCMMGLFNLSARYVKEERWIPDYNYNLLPIN